MPGNIPVNIQQVVLGIENQMDSVLHWFSSTFRIFSRTFLKASLTEETFPLSRLFLLIARILSIARLSCVFSYSRMSWRTAFASPLRVMTKDPFSSSSLTTSEAWALLLVIGLLDLLM